MFRILSFLASILLATLFGTAVDLAGLFVAFPAMNTALSIVAGAILVRLNRGMPSIDWRAIDAEKRPALTTAVLNLTNDYVGVLAVNAVLLVAVVVLMGIGGDNAANVAGWPDWVQRAIAAMIGLFVGQSLSRVVFVVWRDVDIVRVQKRLIDDGAEKEVAERLAARTLAADERVATARAAGLRAVPNSEPRDW